jgi:hypothetical protein
VGWFRPRRKVRDPAGQEWELYVSRVALPNWREAPSVSLGAPPSGRIGAELFLLGLPFAFAAFLWGGVLRPALRFLVLLPAATIKGHRSGAVRIEAICFFPGREARLWTTTPDQVGSVLDEIARGLAEGRIVQPVGAVYSGIQTG